MTTIGRRVDDEMRRRRNDDKTEGTAQPAGRIRRRGHCVVGPIDVGHEGRQGGGVGRESWGRIVCTNHRGVRVAGFFGDTMCLLARLITPPKSMVHPPCKYLCRLIRGQGTRWCPQN
jgi:hypothetical protein